MMCSEHFLSPYSPVLVKTLQNLIAPGQRVRLSPFVEETQLRVLFGERLNPKSRYEHTRKILKDHESIIREIAQRWTNFLQDKRFGPSTYDETFLRAYLIYYLTTNVCKVQLMLLDLVKHKALSESLTVVDLGVGAGTTALAVLDFIVAWTHTCMLYEVPIPIQSVQLIGMDINEQCLHFAQEVVQAYADTLLDRQESPATRAMPHDILEMAASWSRQAQWKLGDLNQSAPAMPPEPTLLVASNVLNELDPLGRQNIEQTIHDLPPKSVVMIIEPGDKAKTQNLNSWCSEMQQRIPDLTVISPCGQDMDGRRPQVCSQCWNARRESMHQPLLYDQFRKAAADQFTDQRRFDEFENKLLSWSYTCFLRSESTARQPARHTLDVERARDSEVEMRYIGSFTTNEPAAYDPDDFGANSHKTWVEFIKLCPATVGCGDVTGIYLERKPGFQVPLLHHGENIVIKNVDIESHPNRAKLLKLMPNKHTTLRVLATAPSPQETFLPSYPEQTRKAVDELAYRLFGFQAMHPFQHRILERVLTGGHILGIAATGGGKSECFILPAILLPGITIVVSPLKSLMQDQYDQRLCNRYGLGHVATYINGDVPFRERMARLKRLELGYYKLAYFTPEQLERSFVLNSLKQADKKVGIRYLALDEAHCISQWGHDFRPSYLNLVRRLQTWDINPVRIALTATASPKVREDLCEELDLQPAPIEEGGDVYVYSSNRPELNLIVHVMDNTVEKSDDILSQLKQFLRENEHDQNPGAAIIFMPHTGGDPERVRSYYPQKSVQGSQLGRCSAGVTRFASYLERELQKRVAIYHGKMDADNHIGHNEHAASEQHPFGDLRGRNRRGEQNGFMNGDYEIMVSTKGFGMGIDKPNIRLIIHRTPTANLEAYAQEAGRAGRDGEQANVILYYSPDSPVEVDNWSRKSQELSDYDIQTYFLSEKYVRREDVIIMRAFLKTIDRRVDKYLYFTNDEAIAFFDGCTYQYEQDGLYSSYTWPKFQKRGPRGKESKEHQDILDRGHEYQEKTRYIRRILSVLYRIRPDLGSEKRLALLAGIQETGACLVYPHVKNSDAIVNSNSYFGKLLRNKGVTVDDLQHWVRNSTKPHDLLDFARFLGLSPKETAAMFWDINKADGFIDRAGKWHSNLLNFSFIAAPKYGPAAGRDSLAEWRDYAGAKWRASMTEANKRAKKNGRNRSVLDDWFGWGELPNSVGWEVSPGPAFHQDEEFAQYLDAFMYIHDGREQNDWAAYRRLLTDYVGVDKDGSVRPRQNRNCLRAVLLGYLKTYEVVTGDNCYSCSRCVSDGRFELDIDKRKSVVVRLDSVAIELFEKLESYALELPPIELTKKLWETAEREEQASRSLLSYIEGWTGKLLIDTPAHQAALWLRLEGMARGLIQMQPAEFVENGRQLVDHSSTASLKTVWTVLETAHEIVPELSEILAIQARACHRLANYQEEKTKWQHLLVQSTGLVSLQNEAYVALVTLHADDGLLSDPDLYAMYVLQAARTAVDTQMAFGFFQRLLPKWDWERLREEIMWLEENPLREDVPARLLECWLEEHPGQRSEPKICQLLTESMRVQRWPAPFARSLLNKMEPDLLAQYTDLSMWWLDIQAQAETPDEPVMFVFLAMMEIAAERTMSPHIVEKCGQILFERLSDPADCTLHDRYFTSKKAMRALFDQLLMCYQPSSVPALVRCLDWFASDIVAADPTLVLQVLDWAAEQMVQRMGHTSTDLLSDAFSHVRGHLTRLVYPLLSHEEGNHTLHASWLDICRIWPDELLSCMQHYLTLRLPEIGRAEDCLEVWLQQAHVDSHQLVDIVETRHIGGQSERIDRLVEFIQLMDQLIAKTDICTALDLEARHFFSIRKVFAPETNVQRADMAAALVSYLQKLMNPGWLTPISLHAELLGYAHRFMEVEAIVLMYPDLRIGRGKQSVEKCIQHFIPHFIPHFSVNERTVPENEKDYLRVAEKITQKWAFRADLGSRNRCGQYVRSAGSGAPGSSADRS